MAKICDHKSVGILVYKNSKLLLIERGKPPWAFAPPAGHVDDNISFEMAAKRELGEEVGLKATKIDLLIEGRKENPCRRKNGTWHYWKIFRVETAGNLKRSLDETKQVGWYSRKQIRKLAERTEQYNADKITDDVWEHSPGLEPVWHEWFKKLEII